MLSYGSSITSAFPNTLCASPASLVCQLCSLNINETGCYQTFASSSASNLYNPNNAANGKGGGGNAQTQFISVSKLEKCTHCGINICGRCLNENQEGHHSYSNQNSKDFVLDENGYPIHPYHQFTSRGGAVLNNASFHSIGGLGGKAGGTQTQEHYNQVKKEFKQMYNFSKEIVEKLHLLNNAIKIEESAISDLNTIKHQVNTKALEIIKQINQEKNELVEQIDNVKRKYES
jgi:hypothetical protein